MHTVAGAQILNGFAGEMVKYRKMAIHIPKLHNFDAEK
jgi:hypothetical protein